jgi:hypothetical protein
LFEKERPRRVKPLLYVYRVLLTGIHLMRTGKIEANLVTLNEEFGLPNIATIRKCQTVEASVVATAALLISGCHYKAKPAKPVVPGPTF